MGHIAGSLDTPTGTRGFVFAAGEVIVLPLLLGQEDVETHNQASAINGAGAIVGATTLFDSNVKPTIWTPQ
jgi:hypothetical protein